MATVTLRPNATTSIGMTVVGAGSADAALADNSDSSYIQKNAGSSIGTAALVEMTTVAVPALAQIRSVTARARMAEVAGTEYVNISLMTGSSAYAGNLQVNPPSSTITTYTGPVATTDPAGATWTQADIDALQMAVGLNIPTGHTYDIRVHELYADVLYNEAPVATPTAPTGTYTGTGTPSTAWTYSDPEGDLQERYQAKVFSAAQYGAGGFDPETSTPTLTSGEVFSAATTWTLPSTLVNGVYRLYVKVADVGSGGRYGAWAFIGFTILVDAPAVPTVTATPAAPNVTVQVNGRDNVLSADTADLEGGVGTWAANANCSVARSTAQAAHGAASLSVSATAGGTMSARCGNVAAQPGQYTGLASFRSAVTGRTCAIYIECLDASLSTVLFTGSSGVVDTTTGWIQASLTVTAPAGTAWIRMYAEVQGAAASEVHYLDQASIAPGVSTVWTRGGLVNPAVWPEGTTLLLQRSSDGGSTWSYVRGMSPGSAYGPFPALETSVGFVDYEAPRGVALQYRAAVAAIVSGNSLVSGWSTVANVAALPATGFYLKSPTAPSLNIALVLDTHSWGSQSTEPEGIHDQILGRADPVINAGTIRTEVLDDLPLFFVDSASWLAFETLRNRQEPLLLQTCYGDGSSVEQYWIRFGPVRKKLNRTMGVSSTTQGRSVTIPARVVAAPAVA